MFNELDTVVLTRDIEKYGLKRGDMGTIVYLDGKGTTEVEFITAEGKTMAVLTLKDTDIRPIEKGEMLHARQVTSAGHALLH